MKTIKLLLVSLFMMLGLAAQAQQVVITKTDGTVEVFQPNEVDSVIYKPAVKYYWYLGSSDDCCLFNEAEDPEHNNPLALNIDYSGWHETTMPTWNNILGSEIGMDAARDGYTWLIMPTEWFNKLTVKIVLGAPISWQYTWTITNNGTQYTAVWADVTARLLYFTLIGQAQTVQVYKNGVVVKEYPASEVASVEVKPVYYYYAGWECPRNEEELASRGTLINGDVNSFTYNYATAGNELTNSRIARDTFYFVIPNQLSVYDNLGTDIVADQFSETSKNIGGVSYRILTSNDGIYEMDYLNIKKKQ